MNNLNAILSQLKGLKKDDLRTLSKRILMQLQGPDETETEASDAVQVCRKCGLQGGVSKYGKDHKGQQRYRCKHCGRLFYKTSGSVISHSHRDLSTWEQYIACLLQGLSLQKCARICGISTRSAFLWRHKILSTLQKDQTDRALGGIVELDETFFSISYKGNHEKSKCFVMPREPHRRGNDCNAQTGSRACVMCAIERNGQVYAEVLGKGQPTIAMLSHAFDSRILSDSIVLSDKAVGARHYFEQKERIQHIALSAVANPNKKFGPPEIRGAFHIQNVNNMHARVRKFLKKYNGVATKYLNHYINLFVWIDNHKKLTDCALDCELQNVIVSKNSYASGASIYSLPPIPCVS